MERPIMRLRLITFEHLIKKHTRFIELHHMDRPPNLSSRENMLHLVRINIALAKL